MLGRRKPSVKTLGYFQNDDAGGDGRAALIFMLHSSFGLQPSRCAPQTNFFLGWTTWAICPCLSLISGDN
jgi:hypothetical protein